MSDEPTSSSQGQPRSYLEDYLSYYLTLTSPHYAVLVTGYWGTGKTFQVKTALPSEKAYYVSLFGLKTTDEVVAAVYAAMFPGKARFKKIAEGISETTAEIPGVGSLAVSGLSATLIGAFLRQEVKTDKPIIFDDLERCSLDDKEVLGIINLYVEHHGCRVIVIAHDQKLTAGFEEAKEKIFGQTIQIEPMVEETVGRFIENISDLRGKQAIGRHMLAILEVFRDSMVQSLRILRHVVEDLARLLTLVADDQLNNNNAMDELVRTFAALDLEWRAGRISSKDIKLRRQSYFTSQILENDDGNNPWKAARERYSSANVFDSILQDETIYKMLVAGDYDRAQIQASLNASAYFVQPESNPAWQMIGNFDYLPDDIVSDALLKMKQQFHGRQVVDSGEMLHIFSLLMMMAHKGVSEENVHDVVVNCKAYIDDLKNAGRLPPKELNHDWTEDLNEGAYGVTYWVSPEYRDQFAEVFEYLASARSEMLEARFPTIGQEILSVLQSSGEEFFHLVCNSANGEGKYTLAPIFKFVATDDFVEAWLKSPRNEWRWIERALRERHKMASRHDTLQYEIQWIEDALSKLTSASVAMSGFAKLRLERVAMRSRNRKS